jgi:hypothetical protein
MMMTCWACKHLSKFAFEDDDFLKATSNVNGALDIQHHVFKERTKRKDKSDKKKRTQSASILIAWQRQTMLVLYIQKLNMS